MKQYIPFCLLIGFLSCGWGAKSLYVEDASKGFNGGFEYWQGRDLVNWQVYSVETGTPGAFTTTADSNIKKEGNYSLHWHVDACKQANGNQAPGIAKELPAKAGATYRFSGWVKSTDASSLPFEMGAVSAHHAQYLSTRIFLTSTSDWVYFEADYTVPNSYDRLRIEINVDHIGDVWLDGVELRELQ